MLCLALTSWPRPDLPSLRKILPCRPAVRGGGGGGGGASVSEWVKGEWWRWGGGDKEFTIKNLKLSYMSSLVVCVLFVYMKVDADIWHTNAFVSCQTSPSTPLPVFLSRIRESLCVTWVHYWCPVCERNESTPHEKSYILWPSSLLPLWKKKLHAVSQSKAKTFPFPSYQRSVCDATRVRT